jgi:hypothetical protein
MNLVDRFCRKVLNITGKCWEWQASKNKDGYGWFRVGNKMKKAHVVAWEIENGPVPDGKEVCHTCDNPSCVNPSHLFLATHAENMEDRDKKGRGWDRHGEKHPKAKLTELEVIDIRWHREAGLTLKELAESFGVSLPTISHVCARRSWKEVA